MPIVITQLRVPVHIVVKQVPEPTGTTGVTGLRAECPEPHVIPRLCFYPVSIQKVYRFPSEHIKALFHHMGFHEENGVARLEILDIHVHVVPDVHWVDEPGGRPVAVVIGHFVQSDPLFVRHEGRWHFNAISYLVDLANLVKTGFRRRYVKHGPLRTRRNEHITALVQRGILPFEGQ